MGWLDGRVALVTGGGSGIGLAVVERFLAEGAQVAVLDRSKDGIEQLQRRHPGVAALIGDVTVFEDNQQAVAGTVSAFGKLDVFVGNAGIFDYFVPLLSLSGEELGEAFDELFAVNVKAYLFGARAAIPELLKTQHPRMIFTVSTAGFYTSTGGTLYTASKHATVGVVRELACELAPTIRVNGVAPGGTITGLRGSERLGQCDTVLSTIPDIETVMNTNPLQVAQHPADHAGCYVLLASVENSRAITGVIINSDGGLGVRGMVRPPVKLA